MEGWEDSPALSVTVLPLYVCLQCGRMVYCGTDIWNGLFSCFGLDRIFKKWSGPLFIWLGIILLAGLDEFHQMITGDRTASLWDVCLDASGALLAILICIIIYTIRTKNAKNKTGD